MVPIDYRDANASSTDLNTILPIVRCKVLQILDAERRIELLNISFADYSLTIRALSDY